MIIYNYYHQEKVNKCNQANIYNQAKIHKCKKIFTSKEI